MNGLLLLDKPYKWTSRFSLKTVCNLLKNNNAGYYGVLDSIATGILPILFGKNKKISIELSNSDKCYEVIACIGIRTSTYDSEGTIISKLSIINISKHYILSILKKFCGNIKQYSPIYSNVKYLGKPSYKYALNNIEIIKIPRYVNIYNIKFIYLKNNLLKLKILCSKGTYIRSLINDIGNYIGCGAYVYYLRRIKMYNFNESDIISFNYIYKISNFYNFNKYKIMRYLFTKKLDFI
ncbi:tRNA pseudouridine(55) synthase TruB [endosymbiont of Pachyrhynchus infernalis]|uniref:tRNA pseudouridine(55) synthase TruB n=1 Tax=endosymbiont of Pachyrhynchus infernalis TaxID=1971488 RepID=UPI000DC6EE50|nr:tRNA pseudouridine(55) synthase TruB [endosymbiont of Pachyrhynchus infernalis]BBA84956.1 tRNA pseudouridine synthase B [endosymbiont of Pachyrhynchus infernalis]